MLRITIHDEKTVKRFIVEGRLSGEWVTELERCWRKETAAQSLQPVLVELRDVRFVSEEGLKLLQQMAQAGAELVAADLVMKALVEEIVA